MGQALVDRGDILLVAAHAVERFRDDNVELPSFAPSSKAWMPARFLSAPPLMA